MYGICMQERAVPGPSTRPNPGLYGRQHTMTRHPFTAPLVDQQQARNTERRNVRPTRVSMSAFGGKADVNHCVGVCPLLAINGHYPQLTFGIQKAPPLRGSQRYARAPRDPCRVAFWPTRKDKNPAGAHDDLVIAVALAVWWATHRGRTAGLVGPYSPARRDPLVARGFRSAQRGAPPTPLNRRGRRAKSGPTGLAFIHT